MFRLVFFHLINILSVYVSFSDAEGQVVNLRGGPQTVVYKSDSNSMENSFPQQANSLINQLSLVPGDLPGYTGWARPPSTDAPFYGIQSVSKIIEAGKQFEITLSCMDVRCKSKNAQFYARMYGPSVLSPIIKKRQGFDQYNFTFFPFDAGKYWIEIVLTSSDTQTDSLLVQNTTLAYEGYLLPDFPISVQVNGTPKPFNKDIETNQMCGANELYVKNVSSGIAQGRWRVVDKINSRDHDPNIISDKSFSYENFRESWTSLGIRMEYESTSNCVLYDQSIHRGKFADAKTKSQKKPHLIMIGDSVMKIQVEILFREFEWNYRALTLISNAGGLHATNNQVIEELRSLENECRNQKCVVVFNSGLHDMSVHFMKSLNGGTSEILSSYSANLDRLCSYLSEFPAALRILETTTAGWPKWGNWGAAWMPKEVQPLMLTPISIQYSNKKAMDVIKNYNNINAIDFYHLTLSRPDNREITEAHLLEKKMVHPGMETTRVILRIIMAIILEDLD